MIDKLLALLRDIAEATRNPTPLVWVIEYAIVGLVIAGGLYFQWWMALND